jgi:hypothetical protein
VVLEIRLSALKHGVSSESIAHAVTYALFADDDFQETDPPKVLILGPDPAGNLLEIIGRYTDQDSLVVFHAMIARPALLELLKP